MCYVVVAVVLVVVHTNRLLDVVIVRFLPFTCVTGLLLLPLVRQLLAQMAAARERTYSVYSVSQYEGKKTQEKKRNSRKERTCRMRTNDGLFFSSSFLNNVVSSSNTVEIIRTVQ